MCNYETKVKANYGKHTISNKHKWLYEKSNITSKEITQTYESDLIHQELAEVSHKLAEVSPKLAEVSPKVSTKVPECKYCLQQFKHKSSLSKHIKYTCMKNKDEDLKELVRLLNLQLETEREERKKVQKQVENQAKQVENQAKQIKILVNANNIIDLYNLNVTANRLVNKTDSPLFTKREIKTFYST
jgi:ATP-dependent Clp protease ATP-binding subunit ClpA